MADKKEVRKCKYEECTCPVREGDDYCSPFCDAADGGGVTEVACECGHPACAGEVLI